MSYNVPKTAIHCCSRKQKEKCIKCSPRPNRTARTTLIGPPAPGQINIPTLTVDLVQNPYSLYTYMRIVGPPTSFFQNPITLYSSSFPFPPSNVELMTGHDESLFLIGFKLETHGNITSLRIKSKSSNPPIILQEGLVLSYPATLT